ncbi:MAG: RNA polymerase sigma factor [Candidatus Saccharibacteria bacterium]
MNEFELNNALFEAQQGKQEAFGRIYDHFRDKIYRFVFFRIGHREISEDILADTFVKAWVKIGQVNSPKALSGWLYQVAKNNIIDYYRIRKTTVDLEEVEDFLEEDAINPVDEANLTIEHRKIMILLERLPADQQEVIRYKFFEDMTNEEIAHVMNKTEGAIRVIQHRAILKLKELLHKKNI